MQADRGFESHPLRLKFPPDLGLRQPAADAFVRRLRSPVPAFDPGMGSESGVNDGWMMNKVSPILPTCRVG